MPYPKDRSIYRIGIKKQIWEVCEILDVLMQSKTHFNCNKI